MSLAISARRISSIGSSESEANGRPSNMIRIACCMATARSEGRRAAGGRWQEHILRQRNDGWSAPLKFRGQLPKHHYTSAGGPGQFTYRRDTLLDQRFPSTLANQVAPLTLDLAIFLKQRWQGGQFDRFAGRNLLHTKDLLEVLPGQLAGVPTADPLRGAIHQLHNTHRIGRNNPIIDAGQNGCEPSFVLRHPAFQLMAVKGNLDCR